MSTTQVSAEETEQIAYRIGVRLALKLEEYYVRMCVFLGKIRIEVETPFAGYVRGRIETPKYVITFEPLGRDSDYCIAGLLAGVELKDRVEDTDIENIVQLVATVFRM